MLVAVESFDGPQSKNLEETQLVLIQAPVVLDVRASEPSNSESDVPRELAPLLACPCCNKELRVDILKIDRPFRCPLCFHFIVANEYSDPIGHSEQVKKIALRKARSDVQERMASTAGGNRVSKGSSSSGGAQQEATGRAEIWPAAPVVLRWKADLALRLALYAILYLGLIVLLIGVYRQNWFVSATMFFLVGFAFFALLGRQLGAKKRERNLHAQFRFLNEGDSDGPHWVSKMAVLGFAILLMGEALAGIFALVQALEAPDDFYFVAGMVFLALILAVIPPIRSFFRMMRKGFRWLHRSSLGSRVGAASGLSPLS
ncbi:MAG: hypothetical protein ACJ8FY_28185 [Gemmataceae bacterium]